MTVSDDAVVSEVVQLSTSQIVNYVEDNVLALIAVGKYYPLYCIHPVEIFTHIILEEWQENEVQSSA